ncbi:ATP-dependent RNA helicase DbpA [Thiofilum flexile]|uniref:ATP-dependent RNA helicase DbpA n=1 Tax=Thiofilum flexile TaxID=125627 RepID=UPI000367A401|nr:ATP-dependent RNA helicase DbpA [Thiofilum flexile]
MSSAFTALQLPTPQLENLASLGYNTMTPIQAEALPPALKGFDLIAQAKTGSGKTAVFALTLLHKLEAQQFHVQGLVLCPTRELSTQVANEIRRLAKHLPNIKVVTLFGGQPLPPQAASLQHGAHIVVGTPGRIHDHLGKGTLDLRRVHTLVLDEADRMLEMGFQEDIDAILHHTPKNRQTLLFSATYPDDIRALSAEFQNRPIEVKVESVHTAQVIEQRSFICSKEQRLEALEHVLHAFQPRSAVIFCNMKVGVREVTEYLKQAGFSIRALHGELEQRERDEVLIQFKHQSCQLLVATDVAARGLDIEDLPCVINYELPQNPDVYIHRIGRTGRAGREGLALNLLTESERVKLIDLEELQNTPLETESIHALEHKPTKPMAAPFVTLCILGGRKDKLRAGDILGALTGEKGIDGKAVGKIDILDQTAYVAIARPLAKAALNQLSQSKIKGKKYRVWQLN